MPGSMILIQKCRVTDFLSLNKRQHTPILLIASYFAFQSLGRSGTIVDISGVGMVEITASAQTTPPGVSTPVTRSPSERTRTAGLESRMWPPKAVIAAQSALTRV